MLDPELILQPLQITIEDPSNIRINRIALGAAWGAIYNLSRYSDKVAEFDGTHWEWRRASRTLYLGLTAGIIVGITDPEAVGGANFEAAMYAMVPVANELLGALGKARMNVEQALQGQGGDQEQKQAQNTAATPTPTADMRTQAAPAPDHGTQLTGSNPLPEPEPQSEFGPESEPESESEAETEEDEGSALHIAGANADAETETETVDTGRRESLDPRNWLVDLEAEAQAEADAAAERTEPKCDYSADECDCGAHAKEDPRM